MILNLVQVFNQQRAFEWPFADDFPQSFAFVVFQQPALGKHQRLAPSRAWMRRT